MVSHVVLFRPRAGLSPEERRQFIEALGRARREIPGIRGFRVGRRLTPGESYGPASPDPAFPYAAVIDFDDRDGLRAYLAHPAHAELGRLFRTSLEAALVDDYEMFADADDAARAGEA